MFRPDARGAGFTLIEVLIALSILSIVILAVLRLLSLDARTAARIDKRLAAEIAAENTAVLTAANVVTPDLGVERGSERIDGVAYEWRRETVDAGVPLLIRVEIDVFDPEGGAVLAERSLVLRVR